MTLEPSTETQLAGRVGAEVLPRGLRIAETWLSQIRALTIEPDAATIARIRAECFRERPCNDCGAALGTAHDHGCDVERCMWTGAQWIACGGQSDWSFCDCEDENGYDEDGYTIHTCGQIPHECGSQIWDGVWPGVQEAVELGLYIGPSLPWTACGPADPGAAPDLNSVCWFTEWDRSLGRGVPVPDVAAFAAKREAFAKVPTEAGLLVVPWPPVGARRDSALWASCPGLAMAENARRAG